MAVMYYLYLVCVIYVLLLCMQFLWRYWITIKIAIETFPRDLEFLTQLVLKGIPYTIMRRIRNDTVFKCFDSITVQNPSRVCFYYTTEKWTYQQVQKMSFQVANFFQAQGFRKGDVIGLAMNNRPEVVCIWLGLSRIGVTTALINFNLKGDSLNKSVIDSKCKALVFGSEMRKVFKDIWNSQCEEMSHMQVNLYELDRYLDVLYPLTHKSSLPVSKIFPDPFPSAFRPNDFAVCLRNASSKPTIHINRNDEPCVLDDLVHIFTSGTTGLPKAVRNSHTRLTTLSASFIFLNLTQKDIVYCPLPLYHMFALMGLSWTLMLGVPLVIVPKFSASKFWSDIHYYKPTVSLYMGELCRFIVNQPPQPELETTHTLRVMYGSGVKPQVWKEFVNRFKVKLVESYGSSEGNCTLVNMEGKQIGAIGYVPLYILPFYPLKIVKVDQVTGEILRDKKTGKAIQCGVDEPGELVARIVNFCPTLRFEGYTNNSASEKKIVRNVASKGDQYFRSGDSVKRDSHGYFYFHDRLGDTFRWKGENVSTVEVESIVLRSCEMRTTVVYGVEVPGVEGKAGMAAIYDPTGDLDLQKLSDDMEKHLPSFARPIFVRCVRGHNEMKMTGTFKMQKIHLQKEGFDIERLQDPIFIYDSVSRTYVKLDLARFTKIKQTQYRF